MYQGQDSVTFSGAFIKMLKKYKRIILVLTVFIISGLVLISTPGRHIKRNDREKDNK